MRRLAILFVLLASTFLAGCVGLVYTHTTEPLSVDFHGAPVVQERSRGDIKTFQYYVQVQWDQNGIGQIAKEYGFEEVYYADLETLSVLGIWTQRWAHVYGKRKGEPAAAPTPESGVGADGDQVPVGSQE